MLATDVMTCDVITVTPETTVHELAKLLSERAISGVPVVDAAMRMVGIVSEGDLLRRAETGTDRRTVRRRPRWFDAIGSGQAQARDYIKSHGVRVADIMTHNVVSVDESTELADVATLLETHRIKRVPVMLDGQLVGIISRANLVRAFGAIKTQPPGNPETETDDRAIRGRLLAELRQHAWAKVWGSDIIVKDQIVHLWLADNMPEAERRAVHVAAEMTPGVRGVEEHLVQVPLIPAF